MRISDWSSDVCTSEVASLHPPPAQVAVLRERRASSFVPAARDSGERERCAGGAVPAWQALRAAVCGRNSGRPPPLFPSSSTWFHKLGRASVGANVGRNVLIWEGAG